VVATIALPWLVLSHTGSAALAGLGVATSAIGAAVGGLVAGRVVDRLGATRASVTADLLSAAAVLPLPVLLVLDALSTWQVALLVLAGSVVDASGSTARNVLLPAAADASDLPRERANALFTSAEHLGYLIGAPLAGLVIATAGVPAALWLTVVASAAAAALVAGRGSLRTDRRQPTRSHEASGAGLREAVDLVRRDPVLRAILLFPTVAVLVIGSLNPVVLPVLAHDVFGDPVVLGVTIATYGAGGLLGAAAFGVVGRRVRRRTLYAGIFATWPSAYAVLSFVTVLPVTLAALFTIGAAAGLVVPLQVTVRQERTPPHLLAHVVGLGAATIPVAAPVGALLAGVLIDVLGLRAAMTIQTALALSVGLTALTSRGLRALDHEQHEGGEPLASCVPSTRLLHPYDVPGGPPVMFADLP
jgi:predicted MFS family arabinose efflux permease